MSEPVLPPLVLLVHGIRTHAEWFDFVKPQLEAQRAIVACPRYYYFNLFEFLLPGPTRRWAVNFVHKQIRSQIAEHKGEYGELIIVAHSFGTYCIAEILREDENLDVNRLLLCGSVVKETFPWSKIRQRVMILNDCGPSDIWPPLARSVTWGYGATGTFGMPALGKSENRFNHPEEECSFKHSDYFDPEFVKTYWLPFILKGEILPEKEKERQIHRRSLLTSFLAMRLFWMPWLGWTFLVICYFMAPKLWALLDRGHTHQTPSPQRSAEELIKKLGDTQVAFGALQTQFQQASQVLSSPNSSDENIAEALRTISRIAIESPSPDVGSTEYPLLDASRSILLQLVRGDRFRISSEMHVKPPPAKAMVSTELLRALDRCQQKPTPDAAQKEMIGLMKVLGLGPETMVLVDWPPDILKEISLPCAFKDSRQSVVLVLTGGINASGSKFPQWNAKIVIVDEPDDSRTLLGVLALRGKKGVSFANTSFESGNIAFTQMSTVAPSFEGCDFSASKANFAPVASANFRGARFDGGKVSSQGLGQDFANTMWVSTALTGNYISASFQRAKFHFAQFVNANFWDCDFRGALFSGAELDIAVSFHGCDFRGAVFAPCNAPITIQKTQVLSSLGKNSWRTYGTPQNDSVAVSGGYLNFQRSEGMAELLCDRHSLNKFAEALRQRKIAINPDEEQSPFAIRFWPVWSDLLFLNRSALSGLDELNEDGGQGARIAFPEVLAKVPEISSLEPSIHAKVFNLKMTRLSNRYAGAVFVNEHGACTMTDSTRRMIKESLLSEINTLEQQIAEGPSAEEVFSVDGIEVEEQIREAQKKSRPAELKSARKTLEELDRVVISGGTEEDVQVWRASGVANGGR